ncbi:MAG: DUF1273 family protein [Clostridia bacterium]|nr:DUF1273 family protein [Clostridia bacterium]
MEASQTLFFTGHRNIYRTEGSEPFELLYATVRSFAARGYRNFISGGALGFDTMAAECVIKLKGEYADARLVLMLPCKEQSAKWSAWEARKYNEILRAADKIIYTAEEYSRECMFVRDRAMADASSACIAYCTKDRGGTAYTVAYALKKGLPVTNLATAF